MKLRKKSTPIPPTKEVIISLDSIINLVNSGLELLQLLDEFEPSDHDIKQEDWDKVYNAFRYSSIECTHILSELGFLANHVEDTDYEVLGN